MPVLRAASSQIQATSLSSLRPGRLPTPSPGPATSQGTVLVSQHVPCHHDTAFTGRKARTASFLASPSLSVALPSAGGDLCVAKCRWPCPVLIWLELSATAYTLCLGFQDTTRCLSDHSVPTLFAASGICNSASPFPGQSHPYSGFDWHHLGNDGHFNSRFLITSEIEHLFFFF